MGAGLQELVVEYQVRMVRIDGALTVTCSACNQPQKSATPRGSPVAKGQAGNVAQVSRMPGWWCVLGAAS